MTSNQIAYWNLQETKRTNKENEDIKSRSADASQLGSEAKYLQAQAAHRQADISGKAINEQIRHNKNQEKLQAIKTGIDAVTGSAGAAAKMFSLF